MDPRVQALLKKQGITSLYPPQEEAWKAVDKGGNVVVAVPTASGKSLVAYLALLHNFLRTGRKGIYIVPLRALASEKFDELREFRELGVKIGIATGDLDEKDPRLGANDIIVCTSEKADSLLRHKAGWVQEIGCVVADEVHLIHDPNRGPTLEVILSRFKALYNPQIIALSATISNADEVAGWLDAELISSDWRPVSLRRATFCQGNLEWEDNKQETVEGKEPVESLCLETIADGGQCLVFVSTRRSAEAQAVKLGGPIRATLDAEALAELEGVAAQLEGEGPTVTKLRKLITAGVAYHTAALDAKQRRIVETAFRARQLKVLCATPTLAAGVNTPARRVIIRDLMRFEMGKGTRPLPVMEVQQMMGRAGRPRYDPHGEAILICKSEDMAYAATEEYIHGQPEPVSSKLAADASLRIHTLASIAGGYCNDEASLLTFLKSTFWAQEAPEWVIRDRLDDVIWFLENNGFIEQDGGGFKPTPFGKRASDLYIDPFSALRIKLAFSASKDPTHFSFLQVVAGCPDVYPLYLRQADDWVRVKLAERADELLLDESAGTEDDLSFLKTACLLQDWCEEVPHETIEERFQVGPGDIRLRIDTSKWLLHAFTELSRLLRPEWTKELAQLGNRLEHGIRKELLPLVALKNVGRRFGRVLHAAGYTSIAKLKLANADDLAKLPGFGEKRATDVLLQVGVTAQFSKEPSKKSKHTLMDFDA